MTTRELIADDMQTTYLQLRSILEQGGNFGIVVLSSHASDAHTNLAFNALREGPLDVMEKPPALGDPAARAISLASSNCHGHNRHISTSFSAWLSRVRSGISVMPCIIRISTIFQQPITSVFHRQFKGG